MQNKKNNLFIQKINNSSVILVVLLLMYLGFSFQFANMLADKGRVIKDLEQRRVQLSIEQKQLLEQRNHVNSLSVIKEEAVALGFIENDEAYEFIKPINNIASR